jgi:CBS domain-containing protein
VGYDVIYDLLQNHIPVGATLGLVGVKALVWVFALASGTSGGVLAPLLIMGAALGSIEGSFLPVGSGSLWALVGMASILGGMMRAPFTACFFALELTHDVSALPPLLAASIAAYAYTVRFMPRSILTEKVARRGYDIFREYSVDPLESVRIEECMTGAVVSLQGDLTPGEAIARHFSGPAGPMRHRGYPVVDAKGAPLGVVTASDLINPTGPAGGKGGTLAERINGRKLVTAHPKESCRVAAERMALHQVGRLLVISLSGELVGIITRSDLLKARLRRAHEETMRDRVFRIWSLRPEPQKQASR